VGILFGGKSAEHEVSLQSAKNVIAALDKDKYESVLIGIDKTGRWYLGKNLEDLAVALDGSKAGLGRLLEIIEEKKIEVVFPILHGPYGEDGTIQGLLKLANIPFVGAGVLGSAMGMDKEVAKRLLRDADIPIAKFKVFLKSERKKINYEKIVKEFGLPLFVKPANLGSSVGVNKIKNRQDFVKAVKEAFLFDRKILVEKAVESREIECSVLGNEYPLASLPGEVIPARGFYDYEAKYLDKRTVLQIPAKLPKKIIRKVQKLALKTYKVLCCEGMARVDMFLQKDGEVLINEINTIPGFTNISMYPKLWEISGLCCAELLDKLIKLAFQRFQDEQKLKTSR